MKKFTTSLVLILGLGIAHAHAQSITDDIQQLVLDYQKLSELKKILTDMQDGYKIISQGYEDIKNIAQGNFSLHKLFLDGLLAVSPTVQNDSRVTGIIDAETALVSEYRAGYARFGATGHFSPQELSAIASLYAALFHRAEKDIDELTMVITPGSMRMNDAERLGAIDRISKDMSDNLALLRGFNKDGSIQALQRARDANDIGTMKSIYGITN